MIEPPTARDIWADVAEAVEHFRHVRTNASFRLAEKMAEQLARTPQPRFLPEAEWLTDDGRKRGAAVLEPTIRRAMGRWYLAREYGRCRRDLASKAVFGAIEILTQPPRVCCDAACALNPKRFTVAQRLPTLPLASCDFDFCGCDYRSLSHPELERGG